MRRNLGAKDHARKEEDSGYNSLWYIMYETKYRDANKDTEIDSRL